MVEAPSPRRSPLWLLVALLALLGAACGDDDGGSSAASSDEPSVREALGEALPANAPGQRLTLDRVTINPGARLPTHFHDGTQVATIVEGELTYDVVEGEVEVTRADGSTETVGAPASTTLGPGDWLIETQDLVHFGSNATDEPVVILLAALIDEESPPATPVDE